MAKYVNLDKIIAKLEKAIEEHKADISEENAITAWIFKRFIAELEKAPAVDVAPVRHGHWNTGYFHDRVCSCCLHPDNDINDYAHYYCPHCGAKMNDNEVE